MSGDDSLTPGWYIASKGPHGMIITMNAWVDPANVDAYMKLLKPVLVHMREKKECLFCDVSQNPQDPGHIRAVHGWTQNSDWFNTVSYPSTTRGGPSYRVIELRAE